jgi:hypothetical protein
VRMFVGDVQVGIHSARLPIRTPPARACSRSSKPRSRSHR